MVKPCFVYRVTRRETGDCYIGISVDPAERWKTHKRKAKQKPEVYFHRALAKHGVDAFDWEVIRKMPSRNEAQLAELCLIYLQEPQYNITPGGDGGWDAVVAGNVGKKHSPERKQKIAAAQLGRKHTPESCEKMSHSRTGLKRSPEAVQKTALANTGKKRSPETCAKLSVLNLGRKASPETRAKQSAFRTGKKHPPEFGAAVSIRNLGNQYCRGKKKSPETRARMSAAQLLRYAKERQQCQAA